MNSAVSTTTQTHPAIIVMGVSGCGKTTLGSCLAKHFNWTFADADDFHSEQSKQHMASGLPLTDTMREPWINSLLEYLNHQSQQQVTVLAFSGLRRAHRQKMREQLGRCYFLWLDAPYQVIKQRMQARNAHFMPAALLKSQFDSLDLPTNEQDVTRLDVSQPFDKVFLDAIGKVNSLVK